MRTAIVALVTVLALVTTAAAGPRKVLVLPLDGNAAAAQKAQLNDSLAKLAKAKIDGDVTVGDTTFQETAAAVGCDPNSPQCSDTVLSTLAVDELVYGTATTENGQTTVTVHRATKGVPPSSQAASIAQTDTGDKIEPGLGPAFGAAPAPGAPTPREHIGSHFFDTRERKLGVALAAGGVIALAVGISFWLSKSDLQDQIDNHPTRTTADFQAITALEDRASSKALWGNIMVGVGLGLGAAGGYFLYKDHENRNQTLTPAPVEGGGMALVWGGRW